MTNRDDHHLIEAFQNGDSSAFEAIVVSHQDRIYNLCRHMLGNDHDAQDAAQDVFLKAYKALPRFRPDASLYTWLYRIATNTCIDYKRRPFFESLFGGSDDEERLVHDRASDAPSPERLYHAKQIDRALQECLGRLSAKLRAIILLKEVEGLSYLELAETLDISIGTVKSRIARARDELHQCMTTEQTSDSSV